MKHNLIRNIYHEWQDYINDYLNDFVYFNEFLESKGYQCDILAVGKKIVIYKIKINNLIYLINDYTTTIEIRYYDDKSNKYINIHKYLI